jgi:hypothetical protein
MKIFLLILTMLLAYMIVSQSPKRPTYATKTEIR